MKAIQFSRFGGPEVLEYVDMPKPVPAADEILIEVTAAGVNFPDIRERMGVYNREETKVGGVILPGGKDLYDQMLEYVDFAENALETAKDRNDFKQRLLERFPNHGGVAVAEHQLRFLFRPAK